MYVIILNVKGLLNWLHLAEVLFKCLVVVIYLINRSVLRATGTILLYFIYLFTEYPSTEKQQRLPSLHQQSAICASIPSPATVPCSWRKQIPWPHCKPSEPASLESLSWDGICAFTRFKSFQVNLMCCQVRGAQKACLGFLFLNFSIFSIIIAIRVGALLIEREKNSVKEILFQNRGDSIWHWRWGNNPPAFFCPEQGKRALISRGPFRLGSSQKLNMGWLDRKLSFLA